ncbi:FAD-dependent oxidoreductase [Cellulomonas xiejunii]|uniref:FAD-dependent oxidoreductase n=1 Tax=Cellulomonas xiejunii TaxID=2968083 RepID=UPI001D0F49C6|nr:FAD-dependent oxidoreductase [Cellulomonas xiejunii]MCC2314671.1 FAD-dependent oxidoreductase [Cellulomonas xiejunii]
MASRPPHFAVVGAGPAGCYAVQQLLLRSPDATIDVYEQRAHPYGLLELGVAPDHPGTKAVRRQFERALASPRVSVHLNAPVSRAGLQQLRERTSGVVLAAGAAAERVHPVAQAVGERAVTGSDVAAWANGVTTPTLGRWRTGSHVVVIGSGNVALDVARILGAQATGTALPGLAASAAPLGPIVGVHLVSRADAAHGPFSPSQLRELTDYGLVLASRTSDGSAPALEGDARARCETVAALPVAPTAHVAPLSLHLSTVVRRDPADPTSVVLVGPDGTSVVPDASVVSAIGFTNEPGPHDREHTARVLAELPPGPASVVRVGWARSGGRGNLATARRDGVAAAVDLTAAAHAACQPASSSPSELVLAGRQPAHPQPSDDAFRED